MRPALSVVAFTVLSGAGLGMLVIVAFASLYAAATATAPPSSWPMIALAGLALLVIGLGASTLHLGNPRNAWRSLSRLRSSWLSREAAVSLALLPIATGWIAALHWQAPRIVQAMLAVSTVVLAWATLICTAMIYASLKPIRQWYTPRVPLGYVALGHASGAVVVVAMLRVFDQSSAAFAVTAGALLVAAALVKLDYYAFLASDRGRLTLEDAIGVDRGVGPPPGAGTVMQARLLDVGHSRGTFLTHEFVHFLSPSQRVALRLTFWLGGVALPALWLVSGLDEWPGAVLALIACFAGLFAERWLFFAEARHTVALYHGLRST